eukprot:1316875-Amorphochlora_amoeboformis.AAC.1
MRDETPNVSTCVTTVEPRTAMNTNPFIPPASIRTTQPPPIVYFAHHGCRNTRGIGSKRKGDLVRPTNTSYASTPRGSPRPFLCYALTEPLSPADLSSAQPNPFGIP